MKAIEVWHFKFWFLLQARAASGISACPTATWTPSAPWVSAALTTAASRFAFTTPTAWLASSAKSLHRATLLPPPPRPDHPATLEGTTGSVSPDVVEVIK